MNVLFICVIVLDYMCCTYSIICWSNKKYFWVFLVVFRKCFLFWKISENAKFFTTLFLATLSQVMPVASLLRSSRDSLVSESPSHEKHLENFSKFLGFVHFRNLVTSGSSSRELTQKVSWLTHGWTFQLRKRLRQNFQNFVHGILVTRFSDLLTS